MAARVEEIDVLVVGAGPAGLTAATELARRGIASLLIEKRTKGFSHPRATVASIASMETFRAWGIEEQIREAEMDGVIPRGWITETLSSPEGIQMPTGLPTLEQSAALSPTAAVCVAQDDLEPILLSHLLTQPAATVERGTELIGLERSDEGVEAVVCHADGEVRTIRARYVIGADGAHSAVRSVLGMPMRGPGVIVDAVSALIHAPIHEIVGEPIYALYPITHPDAPGVFVAAGRGDRWIYGTTAEPGALDASRFDEAEIARRIRIGAGDSALPVTIDRIGTFSYTAEIADSYRDGDVFLIGDAAHRVSPRGGTGMNTAIADARDLAWKLAWVLRGWAGAELLETYEAERRPVAVHNMERSADDNGSVREVADEVYVDIGGRVPHLWIDREANLSTIDLAGEGLTLVRAEGTADAPLPEPLYGEAPIETGEVPAVVALVLGIAPGGSLFLRPDGVPARAPAGVALA